MIRRRQKLGFIKDWTIRQIRCIYLIVNSIGFLNGIKKRRLISRCGGELTLVLKASLVEEIEVGKVELAHQQQMRIIIYKFIRLFNSRVYMFVKRVGYLLLVQLKLFAILAKVAPILMFVSPFILYALVGLKQQFKFQEPSLKTKLFDVRSNASEVDYQNIYQGVRYSRVRGLLDNECILIAFPALIEQHEEIKNMYHTLIHQAHNSKSIALLSYKDLDSLKNFFLWYFNPQQNIKFSLGAIRAGLNIQISQTDSSKEDQKDKAYLKIYTRTIHPDLDYFQALKQLLEKLNIIWTPCQQIYKYYGMRMMKRGLTYVNEYVNSQTSLKLFYDHVLCELSQHLHREVSPHQILMANGFQAATIKFILTSNQMKSSKLLVSFVNEFGMQQDHLHSAKTFYYPISRTHFVPMNFSLYISLLFFGSLTIYLLSKFIRKDHLSELQFEPTLLLLIYVMITEYSLRQDYTISIICVLGLVLVSIGREVKQILKGEAGKDIKIWQIILLAIQGLISIYFAVFCFALSYVAIILSLLMVIKPQKAKVKVSFKIAAILLIIVSFNSYSFTQVYSLILGLSVQIKLCLLVALSYYSL